jgi:hypothetical protein
LRVPAPPDRVISERQSFALIECEVPMKRVTVMVYLVLLGLAAVSVAQTPGELSGLVTRMAKVGRAS